MICVTVPFYDCCCRNRKKETSKLIPAKARESTYSLHPTNPHPMPPGPEEFPATKPPRNSWRRSLVVPSCCSPTQASIKASLSSCCLASCPRLPALLHLLLLQAHLPLTLNDVFCLQKRICPMHRESVCVGTFENHVHRVGTLCSRENSRKLFGEGSVFVYRPQTTKAMIKFITYYVQYSTYCSGIFSCFSV